MLVLLEFMVGRSALVSIFGTLLGLVWRTGQINRELIGPDDELAYNLLLG